MFFFGREGYAFGIRRGLIKNAGVCFQEKGKGTCLKETIKNTKLATTPHCKIPENPIFPAIF